MYKVTDILRWMWRSSQGERLNVALFMLLNMVNVSASLGFVWVSKTLIDAATRHTLEWSNLIWLAALLCLLLLVQNFSSQISNYIDTRNVTRSSNRLQQRLFDQLMLSCLQGTQSLHTGDMTNRLKTDSWKVANTVCYIFPSILTMCLQFAGAFVMLYFFSPILALLLLGILPVGIVAGKLFFRKMRVVNASVRDADSRVQVGLQEGLQHRTLLQTLESQGNMSLRINALLTDSYSKVMHRQRLTAISGLLTRIGFSAGYLTAFIWGIRNLYLGTITFGVMTAFLQLVARLQNPLSSLSGFVPQVLEALTSAERLMSLDELPREKGPGGGERMTNPGIRLRDVTFRYAATEPDVMRGFSYDFTPGSKTALMGHTGAGKTTLFKLILALVEPTEGRVEIYDKEGHVSAVDASTRCNIVYVPQGNSLLHGTIRSNLLLADPEATEEDMRTVLHTAAADFVFDLPAGLDTNCFELGAGLSEGQAQRVAIARALLRKGSLLLLDEFNSALDPKTAATIMDRLNEMRPHDTMIFITHRPETAAHVDHVLNLEEEN